MIFGKINPTTGYWKFVKWLFVISAPVTFVLLLLLPVYGWIRPWPNADRAVRQSGITGSLLMIGGAQSGSYSSGTAGESWEAQRERSFIAVPESLRSGDLFTYVERRGSAVTRVQSNVVRDTTLLFLIVSWAFSGALSIIMIRRWMKQHPTAPPSVVTSD